MKNKIFVLDDTCKSAAGGTALTLIAITEALSDTEFVFIETRELTDELFAKIPVDAPWIIGNITAINNASLKIINVILMFRPFVKIEFDYGFCKYRCEQGFKHFTGLDKWEPFGEHGSQVLRGIYSLARKNAKKVFYMSIAQKDLHNKMLEDFPMEDSRQVILGSCFSIKNLAYMVNQFSSSKQKTNRAYAIIDGNGGWHSKAKGVKESILYAKKNGLDFHIVKEPNYEKFLQTLAQFYGLIFLPQIHDTCPRVTIEAKLMGLDLITNDNSQHVSEEWFQKDGDELGNYLLDRPYFFKKEISGTLI